MAYHAANQMSKDNNGNVIKLVEYIYDATNRRIGKSVYSNGDGQQ